MCGAPHVAIDFMSCKYLVFRLSENEQRISRLISCPANRYRLGPLCPWGNQQADNPCLLIRKTCLFALVGSVARLASQASGSLAMCSEATAAQGPFIGRAGSVVAGSPELLPHSTSWPRLRGQLTRANSASPPSSPGASPPNRKEAGCLGRCKSFRDLALS
jgi:hypothetical protein